MKRCRKLIAGLLGTVLLPPGLWLLLVTLGPTEWARVRVESCVARSTGRPTHLGSLRFRALGGVRLQDLRIEGADSPGEPWLHVEDLRIDIHPLQLLTGRVEPRDIEARGVSARLRRRADGTFDLVDLIACGEETPSDTTQPSGDESTERSIAFRLSQGGLTVHDEPTNTRLRFEQVSGHGTWRGNRIAVDDFHGLLNNGRFALLARLDRSGREPRFEGQLSCRGVALNTEMELLSYFVPILTGARAGVGGHLDLDLELRGHGATAEGVADSLKGSGSVKLEPIHLDGSQLMSDLGRTFRFATDQRVGSFQSDFSIAERRVSSREMILTLGRYPIRMVGSTDFDGRLDYQVHAGGLASQVSSEARGMLAELPIPLDELLKVHLQGTLDKVTLTVRGHPLGGQAGSEDRVKLERLGRRLLDRIRR
jgi:uncharacterized protein involved in outer membrane biogenesis